MHIRCHWLHLSLLLMKLFKHKLNFGITKTGKKTSKKRSATGMYWFTIIELETLLFSFVCSLRQSDFSLFTALFEAMLQWLAACNQAAFKLPEMGLCFSV